MFQLKKMLAKKIEPIKFDPQKLEPKKFLLKKIEPKKMLPIKFDPPKFEPIKFDPKNVEPIKSTRRISSLKKILLMLDFLLYFLCALFIRGPGKKRFIN